MVLDFASVGTEETPKILKVMWTDANTMGGTASYSEVKATKLAKAISIGYLVDENDERIAICGFMFPDPHHSILDPITVTAFRDVHFIPKSWIENVLVLKIDTEASRDFKEAHKW